MTDSVRQLRLRQQMMDEIERAVSDKAEEISNIAATIGEEEMESNAESFRKKMLYIKIMVSYCKRISNFIILSRQSTTIQTEELVRALRETFWDSETAGIEYAVILREAGSIPAEDAVFVYKYIYQAIEKSMHYQKPIFFINLSSEGEKIRLKLLISSEGEKLLPRDFVYIREGKAELRARGYEQQWEHGYNSLALYLFAKEDAEKRNLRKKGPVSQSGISDPEEIQRDEAILELKNRIHDIMGQRLSIVHRILEENKYIHFSLSELKLLLSTMLRDIKQRESEDAQRIFENMKRSCHLIRVRLSLRGEWIGTKEQQQVMIRVIREAVTNAIRHGKAKNILVSIKSQEDTICVRVQNDGALLSEAPTEKDGILGMRRRAAEHHGTIHIVTEPIFCVELRLPLKNRLSFFS